MSHFPKLLSSQIAFDVARTMLDGFDKHYRLFREVSHQAKVKFEAGDWHSLQQMQRDRIAFYNERVRETSVILEDEYDAENIEGEIWQQIKLHYIGLLTNHHQPNWPRPSSIRSARAAAPFVLQQRLHFRTPGHLDRVHRERGVSNQADVPCLLSG